MTATVAPAFFGSVSPWMRRSFFFGAASAPRPSATRSLMSVTRGIPSFRESARSSSTQGRFVVRTRPRMTGPAMPNVAARIRGGFLPRNARTTSSGRA